MRAMPNRNRGSTENLFLRVMKVVWEEEGKEETTYDASVKTSSAVFGRSRRR